MNPKKMARVVTNPAICQGNSVMKHAANSPKSIETKKIEAPVTYEATFLVFPPQIAS